MNLTKKCFINRVLLSFFILTYARNACSQVIFDLDSFRGLTVKASEGSKASIGKEGVKVSFFTPSARSRVELVSSGYSWDLSGFQFLNIEIANDGRASQTVEAGINDVFWTMGATIIPGRSVKTIKVLLLKDETDTALSDLYTGMHGHPSGFTRLWFNTSLDSVKKLVLFFPNPVSGASFLIKKIWADKNYSDFDKRALTSFVDEFGQYRYQSWPEKVSSVSDLINSDKRESLKLSAHKFSDEWDKYGGWEKGPKLTATGHFRVQKYKNKWWLVDPEGRLFWSNGIDCINTNGETVIKGREEYFERIPGGEGYTQFYSADGKMFDFKACNLYRKYGKSWQSAFAGKIHLRLRNWRINTIGNWSDPEISSMNETPYVTSVTSAQTGKIADPFAGNFRQDLESKISKTITDRNQNGWCIGIFIDNELKWKDIPENIIASDDSQPAKQELKRFLISKYRTIEQLNKSWKSSYLSWDSFTVSRNPVLSSAGHSDMQQFMQQLSDVYFRKCRDAVRNAAPGHLYLGCRFDFHSYPTDTSMNPIIKTASRYCDIVSFNRYTYTCAELKPPGGFDFPILVGEFHFGSLDRGLLHPGLKYAADQAERAQLYYSFQTEAINNPFIVGAHWFQLNDQPLTGRRDGENYQIGFLTVADVPYEPLIENAKLIGETMYHMRSER